jgi:hypothetical protein
MAISAVYEYTYKNDQGWMMRYTGGMINIFRFFKDTTFGSMELAKKAAELSLNEFSNELGIEEDGEFYVRQVTRSTGITGLVMLVKGTSIVGFGVKNGNTSVVRYTFNDYTPTECWKKVVALRSMYDATIDPKTEMPEAIRAKINFNETTDTNQTDQSSILGLLMSNG